MFSSRAKQSEAAPQAPQPGPGRNPRGTVPSIISADLVVNGALTSTGDIQIEGRVEGDVQGACLVIGEKAEIHGEIQAEEVTVRGKVVGRINARKILLASTSHVEGDILHEAIAVESGAFFEGSCRHSDNPAADKAQDMASPGKAGAAPPAILAGTLRALGQAG